MNQEGTHRIFFSPFLWPNSFKIYNSTVLSLPNTENYYNQGIAIVFFYTQKKLRSKEGMLTFENEDCISPKEKFKNFKLMFGEVTHP